MRLTTRSLFGTRLILDIAQYGHDCPVTLREAADRQNFSMKYIEQIARPLRQAGYLKAIRGQQGGYLLNKHPKDITVGEVVALFEGLPRTHCRKKPETCIWYGRCLLQPIAEEAFTALFKRLNQITFANLLDSGLPNESMRKRGKS